MSNDKTNHVYEAECPQYQHMERVHCDIRYQKRYNEIGAAHYSYVNNDNSGKAKIMCMGDFLCEEKLYNAAKYGSQFFFRTNFKYIREVLKESDLSIANLETMLDENAPYTGESYRINGKYHCNAPIEFLDAIKYAGIDLFTLSNNHNLDCGVHGIYRTLEHIDNYNFMRTGLFYPGEKRGLIIEIKGIKIGVLSYSTWFNRNQSRLTELGRETLINEYTQEKVIRDTQELKDKGAEFVLVYIHFGIDAEYSHKVSAGQLKTALEIADTGVDYIVGSHTHSLQRFDHVTANSGKIVPVAYSLGNFITSDYHDITRDNIILVIELEKTADGIRARSFYLPCHVYSEFAGLKYPVVPTVYKYNRIKESKSLREAHKRIKSIMGGEISGYRF